MDTVKEAGVVYLRGKASFDGSVGSSKKLYPVEYELRFRCVHIFYNNLYIYLRIKDH